MKNRRLIIRNGVEYCACRESLARDGGSPPRQWYWVVQDPKMGACIDERVPGEYFKTLRAALVGLDLHLKSASMTAKNAHRAKKRRVQKVPYGQTTQTSETTGIPSSQWFQPKASTSIEETTDVLEAVQSYLRHIELGVTPLVRVSDLLADVECQLMMKVQLDSDWEELSENYDEMESRARNETRIRDVITDATIKGLTADCVAEVVSQFVLTGDE